MITTVTKHDGTKQPFNADKLNQWAEYATRHGVEWSTLAQETYKRLEDDCSTSDIHDTMIAVCLSRKDHKWSKVAARLEFASIRKGMQRELGLDDRHSWQEIYTVLQVSKEWDSSTLPNYHPGMEDWYNELKETYLEYWQVKQWSDKYAIKRNGEVLETPHIGALGIGLAIHGLTKRAFDLAKGIVKGKINLPTPVLNGCRNGDFDGISCCVISGGDSVGSIEVAQHIATRMTAKKAGIGIEFTTRSKGEPVKNGKIAHLGKSPILAHLDTGVKMFTQVSRGGSATATYTAIDSEIESLLLLKSQRTPENARIDKLDYSLAYNDAFLQAVTKNLPWPLFDLWGNQDIHEKFYTATAEEYWDFIDGRTPSKVIPARELLKTFLTVRNETGRVYCCNVTRMNQHTPFEDTIRLSNLCQEIALPTKPYYGMGDLYSTASDGETAFCSLMAINVSKVTAEEYEDISELVVYTINELIDRAPMMTYSMSLSIQKRRSIGIGITGLAGALYADGLDYDTEAGRFAVHQIAERHYYYALKASQKYSRETGIVVKGINEAWLPIDTRVNKEALTMDWDSLRSKPRANSVLVAHMPTESSAVFSDATNGLYPVRQQVVEKLSRKGKVQYIAPSGNYKLAWEHDNNDLAKIYSLVQDFTDQGISADYYVVPNSFEGGKVPLSQLMKEWVTQARLGNKTMYYMNTNDYVGGGFQDQQSEDDGCSSCKL